MSEIDFMNLGDLDGTHGWIRTRGFVNWEEDVSSHMPRQRVGWATIRHPERELSAPSPTRNWISRLTVGIVCLGLTARTRNARRFN